MSVLEFIAEIVSALAWPAAVVGVAISFRRQLVDAIGQRLQRLKASAGGVELEFFDEQIRSIGADVRVIEERQLAELEAPAEASAESSVETVDGVDGSDAVDAAAESLVDRLLAVSPSAAALEAYAQLEDQLRVLLVEVGLIDTRQARQSMRYLVGAAEKAGIVTSEVARTVHELTALRNLLVHRGLPETREDFDRRRASDFIHLTIEMREVLSRISLGRAYEAAVKAALMRIGVPYTDASASSDQGWDLLVGDERRAAVSIKYSRRALPRTVLQQMLALSVERPVLLIANAPLGPQAQRDLDEATQAGQSAQYVGWSGPQDDAELADAICGLSMDYQP